MKYLLSCIFLFLCGLSASAQHMFARQFPFFNQLSSNEIFNIYQDREGFFWISTTNGLARYDETQLRTFRSDYKNPNLLADNNISFIGDNSLYVWIGTWKGLSLYNKQTCQIMLCPETALQDKPIDAIATGEGEEMWISSRSKVYRCDSTAHIVKEYELGDSSTGYAITSIFIDKWKRLWALGSCGIYRYEPESDSFFCYPPLGNGHSAYAMYQDKAGHYWIASWGEGLWQFSPDAPKGEGHYKRHDIGANETETIVFSIEQDDTFGYLWVLSYAGLHVLRYTDKGTLEKVDMRDLVDTHMMYTRICKDREGNLWLSSYDMAYTIFFDNSNVDNYLLPQLKKQMGWDANILNLSQCRDSIVWFTQDRYGLCLYDLSRDRFADSGLGEVNIIKESLHKPGVWVNSAHSPHLMRMTQRDMKVQVEEDINIGGVTDITEDKTGNLWIATWGNVQIKRPDSNELVVSGEGIPGIASLASGTKGEVWGVSGRHIYRLKYTGGQIVSEVRDSIPGLPEKEEVNGICVDAKGCLWLYTSWGRVLRSDETAAVFENMLLDNALDDCTVLGILSDEEKVWIVTNKKVLQYNLETQTFLTYSTADENIGIDVFRNKAISTDGQGGLYVGGHRGFIHIRPGGVPQLNKSLLKLYVTDVKVGDQSTLFDNTPQKNTIHKVYLNPGDRNIEISFSTLLYSPNARYRVAYRMQGADQNWIYLDYGKFSAFYNHLPKGTYKFHVKLEYERGKWTEDKVLLTVVKEPAFYETWFAYLLYIFLIACCFYIVISLYMRRIKLKSEVKIQEELTRTKFIYFTNVSHELLTPLTVISCISDYLDQKVPAVHQQSVMLKANVDKLKRLIQQVLDFRKMDMGRLKLNVSEGDIREFILNICRINFLPLARKKNITLEAYMETQETCGYVDFDKLDKILHNLLSNAIKYTPENKQIVVDAQIVEETGRRMLVVKVRDEGTGIPAKEIEHIFTRFYNSRKNRGIESNGIGLSLTKDLVVLHHGDITVESVWGQGTCFTVKLPVDKESYTPEEWVEETLDSQDITLSDDAETKDDLLEEDAEKPTLLLIDDNIELLSVMKEMFREKYNVLTAIDGAQALDKLNNNEVDMVICDVMLPDVNGWELCTRMKDDLRFNHIPVIILTARNGIDDRVASYEAGADGYIAKPFEMKILFARVDNLIRSSKMRQAAFRKEENVSLESLAYSSADKKFLQAIIDSIEQHLTDGNYDVEQLSEEMHISKSTLYRKIKSMTGLSAVSLIRNVKMKRACMMLLSRERNISEVAYALGFTTPNYFSKCFKKEFEVTPSEYLQLHRDK